jgi:hypothetical protein
VPGVNFANDRFSRMTDAKRSQTAAALGQQKR